jgi:hypothetical protein
MGVMLRLRSLPGEAGGIEGYWSRVFDGEEERVVLACLAQLDAFATAPPIEKLDDETQQWMVVSEGSPPAAVLLHDERDGGWTRYVNMQAHAAWTLDGARALIEILPDELDPVRSAVRQLMSGELPPRPVLPRRTHNDPEQLAAFREQAQEYCALIEAASTYGRGELVATLTAHLVALYQAGLALNGGTSPGEPLDRCPRTSVDEWQAHFASIQAALGNWGSYHATWAPRGANAQEAIELPVASPLMRVWEALKTGLLTAEDPARLQLAGYRWWWGFHTEWGPNALDALRALHPLLGTIGGHISRGDVP